MFMRDEPVTLAHLKGRRVGVLAGGGLSSWVVARTLAREGVDVLVYCAAVDQRDEPLFSACIDDLQAHHIPVDVVDLQGAVADLTLEVARYDAHYCSYWNSTSGLRAILVKHLAPRLITDGCQVLAHGCVGGGNDQRRFARYVSAYAPDLMVYAPWLDPALTERFPSRDAMVDFLSATVDDPRLQAKRTTSVDGSVMGVSYEGTALEAIEAPWENAPFCRSRSPQGALAEPRSVLVRFNVGRVEAIDDVGPSAIDMVTYVDEIAGSAGIGRLSILETKIDGTKMRGVYEAPALTALATGFRHMRSLVLSAEDVSLADRLSSDLGRCLYEGRYESTAALACRQALDLLLSPLTGTVELRAYRGTVQVSSTFDVSVDQVPAQVRRFAAGGHVWV